MQPLGTTPGSTVNAAASGIHITAGPPDQLQEEPAASSPQVATAAAAVTIGSAAGSAVTVSGEVMVPQPMDPPAAAPASAAKSDAPQVRRLTSNPADPAARVKEPSDAEAEDGDAVLLPRAQGTSKLYLSLAAPP